MHQLKHPPLNAFNSMCVEVFTQDLRHILHGPDAAVEETDPMADSKFFFVGITMYTHLLRVHTKLYRPDEYSEISAGEIALEHLGDWQEPYKILAGLWDLNHKNFLRTHESATALTSFLASNDVTAEMAYDPGLVLLAGIGRLLGMLRDFVAEHNIRLLAVPPHFGEFFHIVSEHHARHSGKDLFTTFYQINIPAGDIH